MHTPAPNKGWTLLNNWIFNALKVVLSLASVLLTTGFVVMLETG